WLGLCLTPQFEAFAGLSFITSITTVTPQLVLPLVGDIAPLEKRAYALSLVVSGNLGGIFIARLLSIIVTKYNSWRIVFRIAFVIQYLIVILLWLYMPDYPVANSANHLHDYTMLWSMVEVLLQYPVLVQACSVGFYIFSTFMSYWTTFSFLPTGALYYCNSVVTRCLALNGHGALILGPLHSKAIMTRIVPLTSIILGECLCLTGVSMETYTGTFTVANLSSKLSPST
ncbi:MAG: hypothetical protein Q9164_007414, partial [Protoblastenia rupestris]